jgi:DNA-3-methyladenine glycosylase I
MPTAPEERRETCWGLVSPEMARYHDEEWGVPVHDGRALWEKLMLDGFQAGLSWEIILRKRSSFHAAFEGWDPARIAGYGDDDIARLLADPGIVRNRLKVAGAVKNARAYLALEAEGTPFAAYLWSFVGGKPIDNRPAAYGDVRATSPESDAMSKALRKRGFTFVGSTICYAFMQAVGMVNDHLQHCPTRSR